MFFPLFVAPVAVTETASASVTPRDPTTGEVIPQVDSTGQPIVPRDETGQPLLETDVEGQIIVRPKGSEPPPRADSLLRSVGPGGVLGGDEEVLGATRYGGTGYRAQFAAVEGYNSNVIQTQDVAGGPATPHGSPFTGVDATAELYTWTSPTDTQVFRLQVRGQHYTPLNGYSVPDDGSANGAWNGSLTLSPRTSVSMLALATVTSVNSAEISDGPLFQVQPGGLERVYSLETARVALAHELTPRWRSVLGADVTASTTIRDAPTTTVGGQPFQHRGLDYVTPGVDASLFHDLTPADIVQLRVRYAPTYVAFLINSAATPPVYNGHATVEAGQTDVTWTHGYTEALRSTLRVGTYVSQAPPLDPDRRPILSPLAAAELIYLKRYWLATANVNYAYGSANPRLGFGPTAGAGFTVEGIPFPHGEGRNFSTILTGLGSRSVFQQAGALSRLSFAAASAEFRYSVNTWLGVLGGYDIRYVVFEGQGAFPSLLRHVVFLGLSGFFTTEKTLPTIQTFVSPVKPPG